jgi:hypothetical protein
MAREHAETLATALREYNETAVKPEREGPTRRDLEKAAREAAETDPDNKEAVKAFKAYDAALAKVKEARNVLAELGAVLLGVDIAEIGEEPTDEAKETAREQRKELVGTLKMLTDSSDAEAAQWARNFEIPNVGSEKIQTLGEGGTSRLRVWVDVVGPNEFSERFESLSALKVASAKKDSKLPKVDVDVIRKAYEDATEAEQKAGVSGEIADGWTVTVSPK